MAGNHSKKCTCLGVSYQLYGKTCTITKKDPFKLEKIYTNKKKKSIQIEKYIQCIQNRKTIIQIGRYLHKLGKTIFRNLARKIMTISIF